MEIENVMIWMGGMFMILGFIFHPPLGVLWISFPLTGIIFKVLIYFVNRKPNSSYNLENQEQKNR